MVGDGAGAWPHPLREVVTKDGRPSSKRLHDWALQILSGLAAVHEAGVIHRDIKPSNVVLTDQGTCVLLDFGLAEVGTAASELTDPGEVVGTIRYLSPNRLHGEAATPQADCHAVGISLFGSLSLVEFTRSYRPPRLSRQSSNNPPLTLLPSVQTYHRVGGMVHQAVRNLGRFRVQRRP